jgi:chromosomal replication initiator protein
MSDKEIVSAVYAFLAEKLGRERFELWFGPATRISSRSNSLLVETAHQFSQDWLRRHYRQWIEEAGSAALGSAIAVEFRLDSTLAAAARAARHDVLPRTTAAPSSCQTKLESCVDGFESHASIAMPAAATNSSGQTIQIASHAGNSQFAKTSVRVSAPSIARTRTPLRDEGPRRMGPTLQAYIVGAGNRLAHASAQMVAERPGSLNPFLVFGPPGSGKTHLLEGICAAARTQARSANAVYLSAEQFTTYFVEALRGSGLPNFRRKYRCVDLLLIDDLQFLAGKRATLVELLHTIDALLREGRQLAFAADRPPADLVGLGPELTTRLAGGMVCQVELPDGPTRLGLVQQFAQRLAMDLPLEVAEFVAARVTAGAREVSGAVKRLHASSRMLSRPIDLAFAEEALAELLHRSRRAIRLSDIEEAVCDMFGLPNDSLQSQRRSKDVSTPRMLAMWLARKLTRSGLSEIGQYFGRRSHSTVISAQKRVADWMEQQSEVLVSNSQCKVDEALRRVESRLRVG